MKYWLMKSEPEVYSIDDLARDGKTSWTGVRNYQARNFMTQDMKVDDLVLFYHSNADPPGVAGVMRVCGLAHPDPTQFDKKHEGHEPRATPEKPMWMCVEVAFEEKAKRLISLDELRAIPSLAKMELLRRGSRLSVQAVEAAAFKAIVKLARTAPRRTKP